MGLIEWLGSDSDMPLFVAIMFMFMFAFGMIALHYATARLEQSSQKWREILEMLREYDE